MERLSSSCRARCAFDAGWIAGASRPNFNVRDRNITIELRVPRSIDLRHPAGPERLGDFVVIEGLADHGSIPD